MTFTKTLSILFSLLFSLHLPSTNAATFNITNRCSYSVWAAASPGEGRRLDNDQTWQINVAPGTTQARIWGRTNCSFDANGHGQCQTGDCNGLLECQGYGSPPDTLAEFALNQPNNLDYFDISLVDGFNVPLEFAPTTNMCRGVHCIGPILEQCPTELRTPGGCNNPCTVFPTNEYCCYEGPGSCVPTAFSRFFRERCPDAYNFPQDGRNTLFTCPSGTNYRVTFCP